MGAPQVLSEDSYPFLTIAQGVLNNPDYAFCTRKCPANPLLPLKPTLTGPRRPTMVLISRSPPPCHPDRSEVEGPRFSLSHSQLQPEPLLSPCHPDRSEAEWRDLQCALRPSQILPRKRPGCAYKTWRSPIKSLSPFPANPPERCESAAGGCMLVASKMASSKSFCFCLTG